MTARPTSKNRIPRIASRVYTGPAVPYGRRTCAQCEALRDCDRLPIEDTDGGRGTVHVWLCRDCAPSDDAAPTRTPNVDHWVPACGGSERPFRTRTGVRVLYVWNVVDGGHAYLNLDTDTILTTDEATAHGL